MFSFQTFHLHKSGRENNEKKFYKKSTNFFFSFIRVEKKKQFINKIALIQILLQKEIGRKGTSHE